MGPWEPGLLDLANVSHHFCKHASPFGLLHLHMILLPSFQTNCIWDHANRASQGSNKSSLWCCCHAAQRLSAGSSSSAPPDRGSEKHLHILAARLSTDSPELEHEQLLATKASQCMLYRNISSEELFLKVRVFSCVRLPFRESLVSCVPGLKHSPPHGNHSTFIVRVSPFTRERHKPFMYSLQ